MPFNVSIWPASAQPLPSNAEIARVTAVSTDTFTITRAQEGSSARTVVVGDQIAATITARTLDDAEQAVQRLVIQTSHGFAVGDVLRFDGTNYAKAQANFAANAEVVGIVAVVPTANTFVLHYGGRITGLTGLTSGTIYFLDDDTAGLLTATEPADSGDVSKPILIADSTTSGYFYNWRGMLASGSTGIDGFHVIRKAATEAVNTSTTLQDDNDLVFAVAASEVWAVRYVLRADGAVGGDIKYHVNGPSGVGGWFGVVGPGTTATTFVNSTVNNEADTAVGGGGAPAAGTYGASAWTAHYVEALVVNGATAGNVTLQWAQATSSGTDTRLAADSFLIATRISPPMAASGGGGGSGESLEKDITQTTHGLVVGDVVRLSGANYVKAQANSAANAEVVGIVSAVTDANNFTLNYGGRITGLSGLSAGTVYFLDDDTAGLLTATEPTDESDITKPLLIADATTSGYFFNLRGSFMGGGGGGGGGLGWNDIQPVGTRVEINPFHAESAHTNWPSTLYQPGTVLDQAIASRESTGAQNAEITFKIVLATGTWKLHLITFTLTNAGIYTVSMDAVSQGTLDGYSSPNDANVLMTLAGIAVLTSGIHDLNFKMATKNASSASYYGDLQSVVLERTA